MIANQDLWTAVDEYTGRHLLAADAVLEEVQAASKAAGLPSIQVAPNQGKLLHFMVRMMGARRILEIGTLGGYSTIWLARALPADGQVITLEVDATHASVARANFERAGVADRIELRLGPALETLPTVAAEGQEPFDFIFIDANKENIPEYLQWAIRLGRSGSVIVADNVIRSGGILEQASSDIRIQGVRRFYEMVAQEPRLEATAIQTVGSKGYDGLVVALVR